MFRHFFRSSGAAPAILLVVAVLFSATIAVLPAAAAPHLIVDLNSGKVLSRQQEFDRWHPASLTKLMTVYTAFQEIRKGRIGLMSPVRVSEAALSNPPSKMGFPAGTILNVDTAIKILMVKSANDIASALGESVAGSEPAFVALMNANARRLGMNDTNFVNPHGLHDPAQFTSARDLAVLTVAIRKEFPQYAGYFRIPAVTHGKKLLRNHNPLLQRFDGTTGMKTGFVCASGLNIVATVKRGNRELIAVVLGGPSGRERNVRAAKLLTEAFGQNPFFVRARLETLRPAGPVNRVPTDMREEVCSKKKKVTESGEGEEGEAGLAASGPTLEELEEIYLKPKGSNTASIAIALGNASGPDPYGLLAPPVETATTSFAASADAGGVGGAVAWPIVPGTKGDPVPVPTPRPRR